MTYEEALTQLKRGQKVTRDGKVYRLFRDGLHDVTEPGERGAIVFTELDQNASDWELFVESETSDDR